jgi:hypothetical protein
VTNSYWVQKVYPRKFECNIFEFFPVWGRIRRMSKNLLRIVMAVCVGMGTFVSVASVGYADTYDDGIGGPGDALDAAGAGAGA